MLNTTQINSFQVSEMKLDADKLQAPIDNLKLSQDRKLTCLSLTLQMKSFYT